MTTVSQNILIAHDTVAHIQAWGSAISSALATCGLVKTGDTGQINWTTQPTSAPASYNTFYGYEIWRLNDSLQSTKPVFLRVEYYNNQSSNAGSSQRGFAMVISASTSTDGAGNLNGAVTLPRRYMASYFNDTTVPVPCYFAGDGTYFMMFIGANNGGNANNYTPYGFFMIDRSRDASGNATGDGIWSVRSSYSAISYSLYGFPANVANANFQGTSNPTSSWVEDVVWFDRNQVYGRANYSVFMTPGDLGTGADGTDITLYPILIQSGRQTYTNALLCGYNNDLTNLATITTTVLGTSHTYLVLKYSPTGLSNHCMLVRYE